ncbi:MAG: hypothetical protein E6K53_11335 [Gammaproteobacteria bacterium]|nr:MAG: hypothetical protein E6K53_11335 [Gammaproteobacteria bacterium]
MQDAAKNATGPSGTVYVGNVTARIVQAYNVYTETDDSHYPYTHVKIADPVSGTSPYQDVGNSLIAFYYSAPVGWSKSYAADLDGNVAASSALLAVKAQAAKSTTVRVTNRSGAKPQGLYSPYPNSNINVYDIINPGVGQNNLTDWASGLAGTFMNGFGQDLVNLAATFKLADLSHDYKIEIQINFNDGSHITLKEDFSTTNPKITVDPTSGRDSHNNNVPSMTDPNAGISTYDFSGPGNPTDYWNWRSQMALLGFQISDTPSSGTHGWACTVTGSGPSAVYSCRQY